MSLFGTKPTPPDGLPPDAPRGRAAERQLAAELLDNLTYIKEHTTKMAARLATMAVNDVLDVQTRVFDTTGIIPLEYNVAAGCIDVDALGDNNITVDAAGASGSAPLVGTGVRIVPGHTHRMVPVASRRITLYGTGGDTVSFAVFAAGPRPTVGG